MLTVQEVFDHISHALHGGEPASEVSMLRIANDAGRYFYSLRSWTFADRATANVPVVAGRNYIEAPPGAIEVRSFTRTDSWAYDVQIVDMQCIAQYRALNTGPGEGVYQAAPFYMNSGDAPPKLLFAIVPVPTSAGVLVATYKAGWPTITNSDPKRTALPIPEFAETFFLQLVRAIAQGYEEDSGGTVDQRCAALVQGPLYAACARADDRTVNPSGPVRNGALSQSRSTNTWGAENAFFNQGEVTT